MIRPQCYNQDIKFRTMKPVARKIDIFRSYKFPQLSCYNLDGTWRMERSAMSSETRWKQRYENFDKALGKLEQALESELLSELERAGVIQYYQFTFELAWKTLKDFMEERGIDAKFPRDVIKEAFRYGLIEDGELWLDMLQKRNLMAHTYDESTAETAHKLIRERYVTALKQVHDRLGMDR